MSVENFTYVSSLVPSNPSDDDQVATLGQHVRGIKYATQNSFPNINAPVTVTPAQINFGLSAVGMIAMFSTAMNATIPAGWQLCDGSTVARSDGSGQITVPDLRDRFIVGAGLSYSVGATGGASSSVQVISINGHQLTQAELPAYQLPISDSGHNHTASQPSHTHTQLASQTKSFGTTDSGGAPAAAAYTSQTGSAQPAVNVDPAYTGITVSSGGGNGSHTHTSPNLTIPTLPPFYALCFIARV